MTRKLSIAIDGPAAAGKSTIAKLIAKKYNYVYIDTGAMYRCVGFYCISHGIDLEDEKGVVDSLQNIKITLNPDNTVYLNDVNVTSAIRQNEISLAASKVSGYQHVRAHLVSIQQDMAKQGGIVLDGRDIGTVVLPNADLKIYQVASVDARANRRHKENLDKNIPSDLEQIKAEIEQRDYDDMHRKHSPLKKAEDAILLDTSDMTIDEVVTKVSELIESRLNEVTLC